MTDIQSILRDRYPGFVALRDFAAQDDYDVAVEAFARGGSQDAAGRRRLSVDAGQ